MEKERDKTEKWKYDARGGEARRGEGRGGEGRRCDVMMVRVAANH